MEKVSRCLEDKFAAFYEYMDSVKYFLLNKKHHPEAGKTRRNSMVKTTKNGQYVLMYLTISVRQAVIAARRSVMLAYGRPL